MKTDPEDFKSAKETEDSIWEFLLAEKRHVPTLPKWNEICGLLKNKSHNQYGPVPSPPPHPDIFLESVTPLEKEMLFSRYIAWAAKEGQLDEFGRFLRSIKKEDWLYWD